MKVLLFGTHPKQFNGYSKVVYELIKLLSKRKDIEISVYGFQNFYDNPNHRKDTPTNLTVYDAFKNEDPKHMGFGVNQVKEFVLSHKPDICVIYNDMLVINQVVTQIKAAQQEGLKTKICAYIDQVYLNQKREFIEFVNNTCDFALMFTKFWEDNIVNQGIKLPTAYLQHGFNKMTYFPIPKHLARQYYGLKQDDFIVLNLNRNQPRKRWDICLKAFAEIVSRYPKEPIKLMIATAVQGAWNLVEIYERELKKRNMTLEDGMRHLIIIDNPQRITDEETNILYNVADIGINTCDGEGFGLCQFEEAGIGIPQVVPRIGGFIDYFEDDNSMLVDPKIAYYVDNTRDMVCGEALLCDYMDFVEGIETYYLNKDLRAKHGKNARSKILDQYGWEKIADKFVDIMKQIYKPDAAAPVAKGEVDALKDEVDKIDITILNKIAPAAATTPSAPASTPETTEEAKPATNDKDKEKEKDKRKEKETDKKSKKKNTKAEIKKLKKKLEKLLADSSESSESESSDDDTDAA